MKKVKKEMTASSKLARHNQAKVCLIIINEGGLPVFEYPLLENVLGTPRDVPVVKEDNVDEVLFSGFLTAIRDFGKNIVGDDIKKINFGSLNLSFSRDQWNFLYVITFREPPPASDELIQQFHFELMAFFNRELKPVIQTTHDLTTVSPDTRVKTFSLLAPIIEPFYKWWVKKIYATTSNK